MSYDVNLVCQHCKSWYDDLDANYTWNMGYAIRAGGITMYRNNEDPERATDDAGRFILDGAKASEAAHALTKCLEYIDEHHAELLKQEPTNGWGHVSTLEDFLRRIRRACMDQPEMIVRVT